MVGGVLGIEGKREGRLAKMEAGQVEISNPRRLGIQRTNREDPPNRRSLPETALLSVNLGFLMCHIYWSRTEQLSVLHRPTNLISPDLLTDLARVLADRPSNFSGLLNSF